MTQASLWKNRNFRLVFTASTVSNLGDGVAGLALPWLASLLTRDPVAIAAVAMAGRLPWLLLSLPAGVWTDRADRRRLIVTMDSLRFAMTLAVMALAFWVPAGQASAVWLLAALAFALGAAEVLRDNAAQTLLPAIVPSADLERANGLMWSAEEIMGRFIGPPLAGVLIAAAIALPFALDAASFAASALMFSFLLLPRPEPTAPQTFWPALREGASWLRNRPELLQLALLLGAVNGLGAATLAILVLYGQEVLGLSAGGYGLMLTAGAAGGVLSGLVGPRIARVLGNRRSIVASLALITLGYGLLGLTAHPALAAAALFIEAFAGVLWNVVTVSYRQRIIPTAILGRVNAIYRFFGTGAMAVGALLGGLVVASLEPELGRLPALQAPFLIACLCYTLLSIYASVRLKLV